MVEKTQSLAQKSREDDGPLGLAQVLAEECQALHPDFPFDPGMDSAPRGSADAEQERLAGVIQRIHRHCPQRAALCLSGGGIRSATFSLGVLQSLASNGLLERFTYLSTVSGGGYIGSWLSAWTFRTGAAAEVRQQLIASVERCESEPEPVAMLRAYSNYLTPQLGLFSADTWTLVATILRNLLLNWLVIVPPVAIALLLPRFFRQTLALMHESHALPLLALGCILLMMPIAYIDLDLPSSGNRRGSQGHFLRYSLFPLVLSGVFLATAWSLAGFLQKAAPDALTFALFGAAIHLLGWTIGQSVASTTGKKRPSPRRIGELAVEVAIIAAVGALGGWILWLVIPQSVDPVNRVYLVLAVPALLALYLLATTAYVGLASKSTTDEDREWWSRAGAWVLITGLAWLVVMGFGLFGPDVVTWLWGQGKIAKASMLTTTGVTGIITWIAGKSASTPAGKGNADGTSTEGTRLQWLLAVAAPAFVVALVLLIAFLSNYVFDAFHRAIMSHWLPPDAEHDPVWIAIDLAAFLALLVAVTALASRRVNVNRFSLHAMYRNRLIRAYLGAPRYEGDPATRRRPSPFTGFDEDDNLRMHQLADVRPFHVVNIALNLVRGRRLAWQNRKAASFSVSALHCGSSAPGQENREIGYQRSDVYGNGGATPGISLGTALAISGAAVSPNMGYHSSPVIGLLLTAFNGRLGWWLANPGDAGKGKWRLDGPGSALRPLFAEALGLTDDTNPYVYLSDGGHFENLGLYEMVLRRCRTIVIVDGGCDGKGQFEDLGNAIRKIRIDLGVEIEWDPTQTPGTSVAGTRCYAAVIRYSRCDGKAAADGNLVVLKPVVVDADPVDVGTYKRLHGAFPHESTGDQWFDEDQFESYRRLGLVTGDLAAPLIAQAF